MTEKRFKTSCSFTIRSGNNPICKCMTDNGEYKSYSEWVDLLNTFAEENEELKKRIDRIDIILDDLNGAEYISRDDAIKALNKIDKVVR